MREAGIDALAIALMRWRFTDAGALADIARELGLRKFPSVTRCAMIKLIGRGDTTVVDAICHAAPYATALPPGCPRDGSSCSRMAVSPRRRHSKRMQSFPAGGRCGQHGCGQRTAARNA